MGRCYGAPRERVDAAGRGIVAASDWRDAKAP